MSDSLQLTTSELLPKVQDERSGISEALNFLNLHRTETVAVAALLLGGSAAAKMIAKVGTAEIAKAGSAELAEAELPKFTFFEHSSSSATGSAIVFPGDTTLFEALPNAQDVLAKIKDVRLHPSEQPLDKIDDLVRSIFKAHPAEALQAADTSLSESLRNAERTSPQNYSRWLRGLKEEAMLGAQNYFDTKAGIQNPFTELLGKLEQSSRVSQ